MSVARTEIQNSLAIVLRHLERREEEGLIYKAEKRESERQFQMAANKMIECLDDPSCQHLFIDPWQDAAAITAYLASRTDQKSSPYYRVLRYQILKNRSDRNRSE